MTKTHVFDIKDTVKGYDYVACNINPSEFQVTSINNEIGK